MAIEKDEFGKNMINRLRPELPADLSYMNGRKAVSEKKSPMTSTAILWSLKKAVNASAKVQVDPTNAAKRKRRAVSK